MELWHTGTGTSYYSAESRSSSRALAVSSGNAQSYALDSKEGIENQHPLQDGRASVTSDSKYHLPYPIPKIKLGSNDQYAENLHRLQARRQHNRDKHGRRRRTQSEKPYLHHPKYLSYRARQRCDTGADGKPVWDDRIEDAFQHALSNIEPMGRRKKSQRGRPHGRNELIAEWIFQETGEERSRKQVSSHIQVLNTLLKGIPEWDALITADERSMSERPAHAYYSDSIEQLVRGQAPASSNARTYTTGPVLSNTNSVDHHNLTRLSFEMWVSLPNQMDQALHNYTRLQSGNSTSGPMCLEDVRNWRTMFPSLRPIVETWPASEPCDIIMLEAGFRLREDFPPKFSKLGISLELDFLHPSSNNSASLAGLADWSCTTHMYQHGRLIKEVIHDDCHVAGLGKVKPFFESKWWASTFTQLTEKRKIAEDSKSDGSIELANEASRNFFRGLTVMQEISARTMKGGVSRGIWSDTAPRRKRMAILLWRFSQTTAGYVGTTMWQKLIPPPDRLSTNSPTPLLELGLPPLSMDSIMDSNHNLTLFDTSNNFLSVPDTHDYNMFDQTMDDELCQDGFMSSNPDQFASFDTLHGSFDMSAAHANLNNDLNFGFDMHAHGLPHLPENATQATAANMFELPHVKEQEPPDQHMQVLEQHHSFDSTKDEPISTQPLANFDMNTHKMLQAQLGADDTQSAPRPQLQIQNHPHAVDDEDEQLRAALLTAAAMSDLDTQQASFSQPIIHSQHAPRTVASPHLEALASSQPPHISTTNPFTSPPTHLTGTRPPLQTHHSFAGTTHYQPVPSHPHNRISSRTLFSNLEAFAANQGQDLGVSFPGTFDFNPDRPEHIPTDPIRGDISRPQSQPVLMASAAVGSGLEEMSWDLMGEIGGSSAYAQDMDH